MNSSSAVLIVIVNYRTPALTLGCVESLRSTLLEFPSARIVVVDNGSGDDSLAQFRAAAGWQEFGERISLLALAQNGGYAVGNNAAIRPALAAGNPLDVIWLLNSDTRVLAGALLALVAAMENNPQMGIAGSRLEYPDGRPQYSAFRFPNLLGELETVAQWGVVTRLLAHWKHVPPMPQTTVRTDWVPGASMLIRRALLEQIGLLDENFFMYFEDVDFCRRAQQAGWQTFYVPASRVVHYVGAGYGTYGNAARRAYYLKQHGRLYTWGMEAIRAFGELLARLRARSGSTVAPVQREHTAPSERIL